MHISIIYVTLLRIVTVNKRSLAKQNSMKIFFADGTSPAPMLFTPMSTVPSDLLSRHQQIIDAFLNDGRKD